MQTETQAPVAEPIATTEQATETPPTTQEIWENLKKWLLLAFDQIKKEQPFEGSENVYVSASRSYGEIRLNADNWNGCDVRGSSLDEVLGGIRAFNPEAKKLKEIAELEAKLAVLKGGAK